jgi:hypothetical protein
VFDTAGILAESMNCDYTDIMTDDYYQLPLNKHSVSLSNDHELTGKFSEALTNSDLLQLGLTFYQRGV